MCQKREKPFIVCGNKRPISKQFFDAKALRHKDAKRVSQNIGHSLPGFIPYSNRQGETAFHNCGKTCCRRFTVCPVLIDASIVAA